MATAADLTTYMDAARVAISSDDADTALRHLRLARSVLIEIPRVGSDGTSADYDKAKDNLDALEASVERMRPAARTVSFSQITRVGKGRY